VAPIEWTQVDNDDDDEEEDVVVVEQADEGDGQVAMREENSTAQQSQVPGAGTCLKRCKAELIMMCIDSEKMQVE